MTQKPRLRRRFIDEQKAETIPIVNHLVKYSSCPGVATLPGLSAKHPPELRSPQGREEQQTPL